MSLQTVIRPEGGSEHQIDQIGCELDEQCFTMQDLLRWRMHGPACCVVAVVVVVVVVGCRVSEAWA